MLDDSWMARKQKPGLYTSSTVRGLAVRVWEDGRKVWLRRTTGGREKLGVWPEIKAARAAEIVISGRGAAMPSLCEAFETWARGAALRGRSPITERNRRALLDCYCDDWLDRPVATIAEAELVARFVDVATRSTSSVTQLLYALKAAWAAAGAEWPKNQNMKAFKAGRRETDGSEIARIAHMLRTTPPSWASDWHVFVLLTGLRRSDALTARREDLSDGGWLYVPEPKGGADRAFSLPLPDPALALLRRQPEVASSAYFFAGRSGAARVNPRTDRITAAGVPTPHLLRHVYASVAEEIGTPQMAIKRLLNHAPGDVTSGYIHVTDADVRRHAARIAATICDRLTAAGAPGERIGRMVEVARKKKAAR